MPNYSYHPIEDLSGRRFGRLVVKAFAPRGNGDRTRWRCKCDCGNKCVVMSNSLKTGNTKSCGCIKKERDSAAKYIYHGQHGTPEYIVWTSMKQRCRNQRAKDYMRYGGRGITVCRRWTRFENFLVDMGKKPFPQAMLERKNNSRGYSPDNCYWATSFEQNRNKRNNVFIEAFGKRQILTDWANELGVSRSALKYKMSHGMSMEQIIAVYA